MFTTSEDGGAIFDSRTSLISLVAEAYDSVMRGGILVLGNIRNPSIVYTPLVPSIIFALLERRERQCKKRYFVYSCWGHYNVNLHNVAVYGKFLHIDPTIFTNSKDGGAIFYSRTSLITLVAEAYDSVMSTISIICHILFP
uniref:Uncharacterized protein n=1 Tax=Solanum lycopersicum TaxID=4081 RepID=K4CTQ9_SOLLC